MVITAHAVDGKVFIYDVDDLKVLREEYHISGVLTGVLQRYPQQNVFQGLPLQLMPEDVEYLLEIGAIDLVNDTERHSHRYETARHERESTIPPTGDRGMVFIETKTDPKAVSDEAQGTITAPSFERPDPRGYFLYKYLMQKGYYVLPGIRFGCQYMAYPGDMMRYHSHFNAQGYDWNEPIRILDIVGGGRLGTAVKKCWIVGAKEHPEDAESAPRIFSVEWAAFG